MSNEETLIKVVGEPLNDGNLLCIPIETTAKGLKFATLSKKEWEIVEEGTDFWKFKKI